MSGDELSIRLFIGATSVAFFALAVSQAGWTNKTFVGLLFVVAITLAVVAGFWPTLSLAWPSASGFLAAASGNPWGWFALLVVSVTVIFGLDFAARQGWIAQTLENTAELHLRYFAGQPTPTAISDVNIWRWYSLRNNLFASLVIRSIRVLWHDGNPSHRKRKPARKPQGAFVARTRECRLAITTSSLSSRRW